MKHFLIGIFTFLVSFSTFAYFPHVAGHAEMRLIATSKEGLDKISSDNWNIEGYIGGNHKLAEKLSVSPVFKLSTAESENSELGALASYEINKYITASVAGNINDSKELGGILLVHGIFNVGYVDFMPFIKIDHHAVAELGLAQAFFVDGVLFTVGISYLPPFDGGEYHNIRIMVGTGLKKI